MQNNNNNGGVVVATAAIKDESIHQGLENSQEINDGGSLNKDDLIQVLETEANTPLSQQELIGNSYQTNNHFTAIECSADTRTRNDTI